MVFLKLPKIIFLDYFLIIKKKIIENAKNKSNKNNNNFNNNDSVNEKIELFVNENNDWTVINRIEKEKTADEELDEAL